MATRCSSPADDSGLTNGAWRLKEDVGECAEYCVAFRGRHERSAAARRGLKGRQDYIGAVVKFAIAVAQEMCLRLQWRSMSVMRTRACSRRDSSWRECFHFVDYGIASVH